ncbi:hypothetical protein [Kitasatospora sp. GP82]|uniref:hypothetical protein n=1 Tax=Kitasatospora sp. GP82 TaxID=3035089 RepID=UPI002475E57D|nr:hypothetical protein [Kitasatospora sp. GP82]MDH6130156.1 hypothetical protein [Kitasatospora sp. GP82]
MSTRDTILRVRVTAADADTLRALLRETHPDVGGRPRHGAGGTVSIDAYVSPAEAETLEREGVTVQVIEDATATGRARQAEVGQGNRFAAGDRIPRGLGIKLKD